MIQSIMKYPIGVQSFSNLRKSGFVYVDKSDLVYKLAQKHVCFLCRPRRFGKSLLISTLEAYFKGKKELFEGLKIEAMEEEWREHPVLRIDFVDGRFAQGTSVTEEIVNYSLEKFEKTYGIVQDSQNLAIRIRKDFEQAHEITGQQVVVLIDEYDKPMLDTLSTPLEEAHREVLKELYSTFKACDDDLRFVMLTGVTKFSQVSVFSGFNQAEDISMDREFEAICGITEEELYTQFAEPIREMTDEFRTTEEEMKAMLKRQYDGYHFSQRMTDIYNPFSIINAFSKKMLDNFWFRSGTPTYLIKLLGGHNINIERMLSKRYDSSYFIDYRACVQDPLAMLYQSGYLTIKDWDARYNRYTLDFPNDEVQSGFLSLCSNDYLHTEEDTQTFIMEIDDMLREGRLDDLRDSFTSFLASIPYEANKDARALTFETHFQYTFYLLFRILSCYTTLIEKQNSHGRADIIIETQNYIYIFEFKLDGTAAEALQQIDDKGYAQPYLADPRPIYKIGVNISSETRTVSEWEVLGNV